MLKQNHTREATLAKLRTLRNELAAATNYAKHQRLRALAEQETIADYWHEYTRRSQITQRQGRGAR